MNPTLVLSRPTTPRPGGDPDPVTNPQKPNPRSAYALLVLGLVLMFGAGVLGMVGPR